MTEQGLVAVEGIEGAILAIRGHKVLLTSGNVLQERWLLD